MKFITLAALLATTAAVASAALPVQPKSVFDLSQDGLNQQQNVINDKPVFSRCTNSAGKGLVSWSVELSLLFLYCLYYSLNGTTPKP